MSEDCKTIKVKATSADQGDFVVINEADFDASVHQLLDQPDAEPSRKPRAKKADAEPVNG